MPPQVCGYLRIELARGTRASRRRARRHHLVDSRLGDDPNTMAAYRAPVTPARYELRPARTDDYEALVALAISSADTGAVRVAPRYLCNPVEAWAALKPDLEWVVAEAETGALIGAAQVTLGETEIEGERHPYAGLSGLMVHPDHRRRGVAAALTRWRLDRAGTDAVVAAAIQTGNVGSTANTRGWATQIFGRLAVPVFRARRRPA